MNDLIKNFMMMRALDSTYGVGTSVRVLVHWFLYTDSIRNLGTKKHES